MHLFLLHLKKKTALPVASTHPAVPKCVEPQAGVHVIQREEGDLFSLAYQYPVDTPPSHQAMTPRPLRQPTEGGGFGRRNRKKTSNSSKEWEQIDGRLAGTAFPRR